MPTGSTAKTRTAKGEPSQGFSVEERAAMRARAKELKEQSTRADAEAAVLAAIAQMPSSDRAIAERLHAIVKDTAPNLTPKTWYGMPAYVRDGKVVCYFKAADKFKSRYATLGFEDAASLDDGHMWPTCFALTDITPQTEEQIRSLVAKAAQ